MPNRVIQNMALVGETLLLVHSGAISRYDSAENRIRMLISSRSLNPRCALDGQNPMHMLAVVTDRFKPQVWISAMAWKLEVDGLWRYDTRADTF